MNKTKNRRPTFIFTMLILIGINSFGQIQSSNQTTSSSQWSNVNFKGKGNVSSSVIYKDTLYVGGDFGLQKWNGTDWVVVGGIFSISSLAVYNGCLYAGGNGQNYFDDSKTNFHNIAKWDGTKWEGVGGGFLHGYNHVEIKVLTVFKGALYAGGNFKVAGEADALGLAKWNGVKWGSVGTGFDGIVSALIVFNNALYVGGAFSLKLGASMSLSNNNRVANWDGISWKDVTAGLGTGSKEVLSFAIYKGSLYAGGAFLNGNYRGTQTGYVAKLDGSKWVGVGTGFVCGTHNGSCNINALAVYNDKLYAGGRITYAFSNMELLNINSIAQWDGTSWSNVGEGIAHAPDENFAGKYEGEVYSLIVFKDFLYVGGYFTLAGNLPVLNIAKWSSK